jgi:hypothetical protein
MNIKDLGNYQMITNNTDSPILVGTPQFFTFTWTDSAPYSNEELTANLQASLLQSALGFVQFDVIDGLYNEYEPGAGAWWYLKSYDIDYAIKYSGANPIGYVCIYKIHVFRVADENIPATSPSNV